MELEESEMQQKALNLELLVHKLSTDYDKLAADMYTSAELMNTVTVP